MRHAKRSKLINEDVMNALKLRNVRVRLNITLFIVYLWPFIPRITKIQNRRNKR